VARARIGAQLGLLVALLGGSLACGHEAVTYTGMALTGAGALGMGSGTGLVIACREDPSMCVHGEISNSTLAAALITVGILSAIAGIIMWTNGASDHATEHVGKSDVDPMEQVERELDLDGAGPR